MDDVAADRKAVIVVDLQKDNVGRFSRGIIPNVKLLLQDPNPWIH